jgi:hypothetical protein
MVGIKAGQKVLKEAEEAERLAAEEAKKKLKNTSQENKGDRFIKEQEEFLRKEKEREDAEFEKKRREAEQKVKKAKEKREADQAQRRADEARRQSSNSYGQESSSQNNQGYGNNGSRYGGNHSQGTNRASGSTPPPPPKTPRELRDEKLLKMGRKNAGTPQKSELISLYNEIATVYGTPLINSNTTIAELRKAQKTLLLKLHSDVNGMEGDWNDPNVRFTTVVDEDRETDTRNINTILDLLKTHHIK